MKTKKITFFITWQGKSERSDWFFLAWDFTIRTVSTETVQTVYFLFVFKSRQKYLQLKQLKENMLNTLFLRIEEDDDELS